MFWPKIHVVVDPGSNFSTIRLQVFATGVIHVINAEASAKGKRT